MNESAEDIAPPDPRRGRVSCKRRIGRLKVEAPMRSRSIVVLHVFAENTQQVASAEDEDVVETLSSGSADPAFRDGVRPRRANGCPNNPKA